jgi:membrane protease YdiL (CAAX protease family)
VTGVAPHWRGHLLLFEPGPRPAYAPAAGIRLLIVFVMLEWLVGPRLHLFAWLGWRAPEPLLRVALLLAAALLLARFFARVPLAEIGFRRWSAWTTTEKSYFLQVLVIANIVFAIVTRDRPALAHTGLQGVLLVASAFLWGFYQEVLYRGLLQTELVRRWGALAGIFATNVLFLLGPLHAYHFESSGPPWVMLAGILAVGIYLSALYHRSRNLWITATFHGIGSAWLLL